MVVEDEVLHVARETKEVQLGRLCMPFVLLHGHLKIGIDKAARWLVEACGFQLDEIRIMTFR